MNHENYRPDVDGLRAIAVTLVLLFHSHLAFPGGFVGVDVFFVISGYLITRLILKEHRAGTFRLATFWERRIRRILPAAFVMSFVTLIAGAWLLFPDDYMELASSVVAQQTLRANLFFAKRINYFAGPADLKPLLHTWSLAVEEQFYLFYPLILVTLLRRRPRAVPYILAAAAVVSLAIAEWKIQTRPDKTFFLLSGRSWELLIGALVAFIPARGAERPIARAAHQLLGAAGLGMIIASALWLEPNALFPGYPALLPCLGAACVIYSNSTMQTLVGKMLAWKPVVFVGLISYSLYLWHWPLFAFARYQLGHNLPTVLSISILASTFVLACLSWVVIETPLRRGSLTLPPKATLLGICTTIPLLITLALVVNLANGFPTRFSPEVLRFVAARESKTFTTNVELERVINDQMPEFGSLASDTVCMIWGDSHAMSLIPGLAKACEDKRIRGVQATLSLTPPLQEFLSRARFGSCPKQSAFNREVLNYVRNHHIDFVILAAMWSRYADDESFEPQLRQTVHELTKAGITVAIMLDVADQEVDVPIALALRTLRGKQTEMFGLPTQNHRERNHALNETIRRVASLENATVIDPAALLASSGSVWPTVIDGVVIYRDKDHLTTEGGLLLEPMFAQFLDSAATQMSRKQAEAASGSQNVSIGTIR